LSINSFAQVYPGLEKILTKEFPRVSINILGWHVNEGICVVLFDSIRSQMILVEPLWYGGVSKALVKLLIGQKFTSKPAMLDFLNGTNELMQIGSEYKFRNTSVSDSLITYDLGYFKGDSYTTGGNGVTSTARYNDDGVWRKIEIDIRDLMIMRYTSTNPKNKEKEVIK
jgi:hypothetical protein